MTQLYVYDAKNQFAAPPPDLKPWFGWLAKTYITNFCAPDDRDDFIGGVDALARQIDDAVGGGKNLSAAEAITALGNPMTGGGPILAYLDTGKSLVWLSDGLTATINDAHPHIPTRAGKPRVSVPTLHTQLADLQVLEKMLEAQLTDSVGAQLAAGGGGLPGPVPLTALAQLLDSESRGSRSASRMLDQLEFADAQVALIADSLLRSGGTVDEAAFAAALAVRDIVDTTYEKLLTQIRNRADVGDGVAV